MQGIYIGYPLFTVRINGDYTEHTIALEIDAIKNKL